MNAEYYQSCQYHDLSRSLLVQWNVTSIPVEDHLKAIVEDTPWGKLQEIGFIIPRAEWEQKYPEQVEIERQFKEMFASKNTPFRSQSPALPLAAQPTHHRQPSK